MRKADNLPPSCAIVTKSVNLNFLEPSGPVQARNRTALLFFLHRDIFTVTVTTNIGIGVNVTDVIHFTSENCFVSVLFILELHKKSVSC